MHPVHVQPPGADVRCGPLQGLLLHLIGQLHHGVDVEDRAGLGLLHHAGRDDGDQRLGADHPSMTGKMPGGGFGLQVDARQGAAA